MEVLKDNDIPPIIKSLIPMVEGLGKTLGSHCEVVLHDLSKAECSIVAIANGHVTGRNVGSPVTDFLIEMVNSENLGDKEMELNYITRTKDGRKLKSSTFLIRDENKQVIGALCINMDVTYIDMARKFIEEITMVEKEDTPENFPEDVRDFLSIMIEKGMKLVDKPVSLMTKDDKLKIVKYLHKNKVFNIKGAVDAVAKELNVSRYTIYNYIDEVNA
ncbi:putative transcriptional regulator YheO [Desulfohalotomaculum tongense]|uniref:helix-turn-helix transcriptional regulator n=1 Tax=Desulforadius tongensis TaxID=1216062 RepID=UPI001EE60288|nr:PAS domain-containing protein [Desulforadius tongensis]MBM7854761.1 putative transcriptional regulator YheO [Desulforadius tongensis]